MAIGINDLDFDDDFELEGQEGEQNEGQEKDWVQFNNEEPQEQETEPTEQSSEEGNEQDLITYI